MAIRTRRGLKIRDLVGEKERDLARTRALEAADTLDSIRRDAYLNETVSLTRLELNQLYRSIDQLLIRIVRLEKLSK